MKKVFISLPIKDKLRSEINREQAIMLARVNEILGEPVLLIENYMRELYSQKPLECLGESIKRMAQADCVAFGKGWQDARGCVIERMCAEKYGLDILDI